MGFLEGGNISSGINISTRWVILGMLLLPILRVCFLLLTEGLFLIQMVYSRLLIGNLNGWGQLTLKPNLFFIRRSFVPSMIIS